MSIHFFLVWCVKWKALSGAVYWERESDKSEKDFALTWSPFLSCTYDLFFVIL